MSRVARRARPRLAKHWTAVAAAMFASAWGGNQFTPLLVMYKQTSHMSSVVVNTLLFTYVLGIMPALVIGGPMSDRMGRRKLMLWAPVSAAAGSLILALGAHSAMLLGIGRVLSGVALGLSMAVGGSWVKELSDRDGASTAAGARRAAMSLTAGFGIGAGLAGALAQWGPWPTVLPYAINIVLALGSLVMILGVPETRTTRNADDPKHSRLLDDLKIGAVADRRFLTVVLVLSPWVFGSCAVAYAVIPTVLAPRTAAAPIAFAALCCVLGLTAGFGIQSLGRRIDDPRGVRGAVVALLVLMVGMVLAAWSVRQMNVAVSLVAATVLGCGYGMAMISGLLEVQRIARPDDLAGLTAVFYCGTYLGFAAPAVLAWLTQAWPVLTYPLLLSVGAAAALVSLVICLAGHRRYGPPRPHDASGAPVGGTVAPTAETARQGAQ